MDSIPLSLNAQNLILMEALKNIPYFIGENHTTHIDHIQDIANVCAIHKIN